MDLVQQEFNAKIRIVIENIAKAITDLFAYVKDSIETIFGVLKECKAVDERRAALYKIDFTRPRIQNQETDRRPKLVKKIIR